MASQAQVGRHAPRSKLGCSTCRTRKLKCDERRPLCSRCAEAKFPCEWDKPVHRRKPTTTPKKNSNSKSPSKLSRIAPLLPDVYNSPTTTSAEDIFTPTTDPTYEDAELLLVDDTTTVQAGGPAVTSQHDWTLQPPLSTHHIALSNSLVLSPEDTEAFQYVPQSLMVLRFGKPWQWSMLSYVHSKIACREAGVMRAFISVASMELRFFELVKSQDTTPTLESLAKTRRLQESAANHVNLALKDLSGVLDRLTRTEKSSEDIDTLFSIWFLMIHIGLYDSDLVSACYVHMNGIRSFIRQYVNGNVANESDTLPPASQQLLLFIAYHDIILALGNMNGGELSLDLLNAPPASPVAYDQIFEQARRCLPKLWGGDYPAEELMDDVENYRGLSFLTVCQKLKLSVWRVGIAAAQGKPVEESKTRLWSKIEETGEQFSDLLVLAKIVRTSGGRRVIWTVYHACLDYYAIRVLFSCVDGQDSQPSWLESTLNELLSIAYKAIDENPQQMYRYSWPLTVSLLKVRDPIHRDWIRSQVVKAGGLFSNLGVPPNLFQGKCTPETLFLEYNQDHLLELSG